MWIIPTVINAIYVSGVLLYSIYRSRPFRAISYWSREKREGFNVPPAIKIWIAGFIGLVCVLISFAIRLWYVGNLRYLKPFSRRLCRDLFTPEAWTRIERTIRIPGGEPEVLKSSALQSPYFIAFMAYILFVVIVVIECGRSSEF